MTWYAFRGYATIDVAGVQEKELTVLGFHGYATQAQANAKPNDVGFWQKAQLNVIEADYAYAKAAGEQPGGPHATLTPGNVIAGGAQAAASSVPGLSQIGTFFHSLGEANTWIRVAEVLLGLGLIIVGLARLASGTSAGKAAMKAGKAVRIL